jgi:hypothetical protein
LQKKIGSGCTLPKFLLSIHFPLNFASALYLQSLLGKYFNNINQFLAQERYIYYFARSNLIYEFYYNYFSKDVITKLKNYL